MLEKPGLSCSCPQTTYFQLLVDVLRCGVMMCSAPLVTLKHMQVRTGCLAQLNHHPLLQDSGVFD